MAGRARRRCGGCVTETGIGSQSVNICDNMGFSVGSARVRFEDRGKAAAGGTLRLRPRLVVLTIVAVVVAVAHFLVDFVEHHADHRRA